MKKILSVILTLILTFLLAVPALAAEGDIYTTLDVEAYGTVKVENIKVSGKGLPDTTLDGEYPVYGTKTFSFEHLTTPGNYYYKVTEIPPEPPAEGVEYDDSVYTVWVYVEHNQDNTGFVRSVVLQKNEVDPEDPETAEKPEDVCFVDKKEETKTITRTITYTEYTPEGDEVSVTKVQEVKLKRTVRVDSEGNPVKDSEGRDIVFDPDGNVITYDTEGNPSSNLWTLIEEESDTSAVTSPPKNKWTPDQTVVPAWEVDLNNPEDVIIHVVYTPVAENIVKEETTTITRTITYTEYTPDGKEVAKSVVQKVTLKRKVTYDPTGKKVLETGPWEIASDKSAYGAVDSPKKTGWTPNTDRVGAWKIDLKNPKDEIVHVVYTDKSPTDTVEIEEFITIKRTITFTEYTPTGKEVSKTVVQTVTLRRYRTEDKNGNILSYSSWEFYSGERDGVPIPPKSGWTTNISEIPYWEIDFENPEKSEQVIHVIYTPITPSDKPYTPNGPNTGDNTPILGWLAAFVLAGVLLAGLKRRRDE